MSAPERTKAAKSGLAVRQCVRRDLALTRLEARIALADHEHLATAANDLAVTMTGLGRLQGVEDFHGKPCEWLKRVNAAL